MTRVRNVGHVLGCDEIGSVIMLYPVTGDNALGHQRACERVPAVAFDRKLIVLNVVIRIRLPDVSQKEVFAS